ncbi:hypothetical protein A2U01_0092099, partial [Trifolium medium]|nr:hypothetical protein [Trifolium medium]
MPRTSLLARGYVAWRPQP